MASSNRLDQRGSTKLARHQQSLLLRVRLVGEQKAIAIRPWSHTSAPTVNRKAIYLESNVKWQNMTKDYIISISARHQCAALDLGISILLLPPAVLHNRPLTNSRLGNQQPAKERVKLQTAAPSNCGLRFHQRRTSLCLVSPFWLPEWWHTISKPCKCTEQKQAQQLDALLLSPGLSWDHRPRLKTKVVSVKKQWKEKTANFFNTLPWTKAEVKDICHTVLDLEWSGVGFLDPAIVVLRVVWNAGATSNINSCWKHPIQLWKPMQTQPLSNRVLRACAYQSARQRNKGIDIKILPRLLTTIWQRKAVWKTLFKNNPQELSTLCIYPENSWTPQRMCQSTKHCLSQLMPNMFYPAT